MGVVSRRFETIDIQCLWETKNFAKQCNGRRLKIDSPHIREIGGVLINDAICENISAAIARRATEGRTFHLSELGNNEWQGADGHGRAHQTTLESHRVGGGANPVMASVRPNVARWELP
jgi:hypothetical protein